MNPLGPFFDIGLAHFMVVSFLLVGAGIATMLTKRNAIGILIGVELLLNAAGVNLVSFSRFQPWASTPTTSDPAVDGVVFAIFIIVLAAAEAAVALAIFLNYYNNFSSIDVEQAQELKG